VGRRGLEPLTYGLKAPQFKPFREAFLEACLETAGKQRARKKLRVSMPRKILREMRESQRQRKAG
jgi:hypothetical protein